MTQPERDYVEATLAAAAPRPTSSVFRQAVTLPFAIPLSLVAALTLAYAIPFGAVPWPFGDVYKVLLDADRLNWRETFAKAFQEGAEYRPLFMLVVKFLYDLVGLNLWFYKIIVLLQFAVLLWLFVMILRPENGRRAIAALLAVACVAGLHTSRILFSFFPLNHHSLSTLLVLLAIVLVFNSDIVKVEWAVFLVTIAGLFLIEFGLLIPPVLTVLWLARAKNATSRAVLASWIALGIYMAIRFGLSPQEDFGAFHAESGMGFEIMELDDIERVFSKAPYLFWAYNIAANALTVFFSEPRSGMYYFVESLLRGTTQDWLWLHVLGSVATTIFAAWGVFAGKPLVRRDRQLIAAGVALVVFGSGLGLLYVRDRVALPVGIGYSMLVYVAASRLIEDPPPNMLLRAVMPLSLVAILGSWMVRDVEAGLQVGDTAWERHLEWTERFAELGGPGWEQTVLLEEMRTAALAKATPSPRHDALWTYSVFERRVKPEQ